ncbi:MAG: type II toxin-antitoxin system HipA family toxin [Gemmatimonadaceae bacterium]|nr:type II toxin-antitoxin system HipA family toxin [Gemmatimonadaceae bacterium]
MNDERVGTWGQTSTGTDTLEYAPSWLESIHGRPVSMSLPFLPGNVAHRGQHVTTWFDNLLPDSSVIRRRVARRFRITNTTRDLLAGIGRDCVGAIQILPEGEIPDSRTALDGEPLTSSEVARILRGVTSTDSMGARDTADEPFRISVAGAQEKTALLRKDGRWFLPKGVTPSTHILKLPLGLVGNMRYDLEHSIANEWLCLQLLDAMGFPVATTEMATFSDDVSTEHALVVERFDRQWHASAHIIRLPQEDMCQALGVSVDDKYEDKGGPGMDSIMQILRASVDPDNDVRTFVLAQLAFWVLAAIDGHAKNFSLFLRRDGHTLTPLYDVLSAWPIIGVGPSKLAIQEARLAMSVRCKIKRYKLRKIATRHWKCLADQSGVSFTEMRDLVDRVPGAIAQVEPLLPATFPPHIWESITHGMRDQAERFHLGIE